MSSQENYWLVKSEPDAYSWQQMQQDVVTNWSGVRNYQAQNNLKQMRLGELAFFYHSNQGKEIVGIVTICEEFQPDPEDLSGKFGMVKVEYVNSLPRSVGLQLIKKTPELSEIALVKQSRLSVMPIGVREWQIILALAGVKNDLRQ